MWTKINENPAGYEVNYSVVEVETGRDIAINLEEEEAILIENIHELYNLSFDIKDIVNDYYMKDENSSADELMEINKKLTNIELLLSKINKDSVK